jgi:hypothetical protein
VRMKNYIKKWGLFGSDWQVFDSHPLHFSPSLF